MSHSGRSSNRSHYEILNVAEDASQEEIQKAYLQAVVTYGKDSLALYSILNEKERVETLERIEEAFRVLGDVVSRRDYDRRRLVPRPGEERFVEERPGVAPQVEKAEPRLPILSRIADLAHSTRSHLEPRQGVRDQKSPASRKSSSNAERASAIGQQLKSVRKTKGLSLEGVADITKIRLEYLKALEEGDYDQLPKGAYRRLMLSAFARTLDLDPASLLKDLDEG